MSSEIHLQIKAEMEVHPEESAKFQEKGIKHLLLDEKHLAILVNLLRADVLKSQEKKNSM